MALLLGRPKIGSKTGKPVGSALAYEGGSEVRPPVRPPVRYESPVNPGQAEATEAWKKYIAGLEAGNAAESQLALQGVRDTTSGMAKEAGESAMSRGADPTLFRSRAFASGERQAAQTSADLATRQFQRREAALSGQTGAAANAANTQINLMGENRMSSLGEQQLQLERDSAQQRIYDDRYQRLLEMMKLQEGGSAGGRRGGVGMGGGSRWSMGGSKGRRSGLGGRR